MNNVVVDVGRVVMHRCIEQVWQLSLAAKREEAQAGLVSVAIAAHLHHTVQCGL